MKNGRAVKQGRLEPKRRRRQQTKSKQGQADQAIEESEAATDRQQAHCLYKANK